MSKPQIIRDIEQGSPEWFKLRCGKITASVMKDVLAKGEGKMRDALIRRVAAEIVTEEPLESYQNEFMKRGKEQEAMLRAEYALLAGVDPEPVAFILNGRIGASPDSLVGKERGVEIKSQRADLLIETWRKYMGPSEYPPEHAAQIQGSMLVSGFDCWDLAIGAPKMPMFRRTIRRDKRYIQILEDEIHRAHVDIDTLVRRIKGWGII